MTTIRVIDFETTGLESPVAEVCEVGLCDLVRGDDGEWGTDMPGATGKEMVAWTKEPRLLPTCPLGKFRGKRWAEVEAGFLNWMLQQPTMEADLKWNARREIDRRAGKPS